jgi:hypothetical protein
VQIGTVQLGDGFLRFVRLRHFNESETAWLTIVGVYHEAHALHVPKPGKHSLQMALRCPEAEISDINVCHQRRSAISEHFQTSIKCGLLPGPRMYGAVVTREFPESPHAATS